MKLVYRSLVAAGLWLGTVAAAHAGENSSAKILLHIGPVTSKNACVAVPADCRSAVVSAPAGSAYNVYVCVGNGSDSVGVAGLQFGISYNGAGFQGVDIFSWSKCTDLEFAMAGWPSSNTGNLMTWAANSNCQAGPGTVAAGYFYMAVYTPDRLSLTPRPNDGAAKVADCNAVEDDLTTQAPSALGYADFDTGLGYNPCQNIVPVENTTWGGVKSLFR